MKSFYYGTKEWANSILSIAIADVYDTVRVLPARQVEIYHILRELEKYSYWWQAQRLRNHINLAIKTGRFTARSADSLSKGEEASS